MARFHPLRLGVSALALSTAALLAVGCDSGTTHPGTTPPAAGHAHGHGEHAIGTVQVQGRTVTVMIAGELKPNTPYSHCHLTVTGDDVDTMRIWIGKPSGEGELKGVVTGLGSHPVVDLETPADLEGAVLGVEIEVGGETYTATAELHHDDHAEGDGHDHDDNDHDHDGEVHDHDGDGHPDH
jgi:hypothetical protein